MKRSIYRQKALTHTLSPEQLDQAIRITTPTGWLALSGLIGLLLLGLGWSIWGQAPITVTAQGILVRPGGVVRVVALEAGQLQDIQVDVGQVVTEGQVVATIHPVAEEGATQIISPYAGEVLAVMRSKGDFVSQGTPILTMGPPGEELELVIYVPFATGERVRPGMPVQISPVTVKKEEYGFLLGRVEDVADFPSTAEGMRHILGTDELVQLFMSESAEGAPIQVRVTLEPAPDAPSGYIWTSAQAASAGPPFKLTSGTLCSARIIVSQRRPINLLRPQIE